MQAWKKTVQLIKLKSIWQYFFIARSCLASTLAWCLLTLKLSGCIHTRQREQLGAAWCKAEHCTVLQFYESYRFTLWAVERQIYALMINAQIYATLTLGRTTFAKGGILCCRIQEFATTVPGDEEGMWGYGKSAYCRSNKRLQMENESASRMRNL